ncbi:6-phosphofructokinase [Cytophagaceae bacterium ABcell3]|nr:6-phosphofructokinase [Cytophagaceae bacterium ABcell3]
MKKIAVFTSGGDAPGMNACIRAVVRSGHYFGLDVFGVYRGYDGMINGDFIEMDDRSVSNIIQKGGTILKSARSEEFRTKEGRRKAYEKLKENGIEGIIAIGGNGTFTGAELFYNEFEIPCIGVPGTIDNDLFGTDFTIGYDTAVNTALAAIDKIRDTADAHERIFFIEVMGRDTGYIAVRSAIAGGAEMALMPETKDEVKDVITKLKYGSSQSKASHIIIVAEGEETGGAHQIAQNVKQACPHLDTKVTTLGHVQRGGAPSASDRVLASRLGLGAVEGLIKGKSNVMVGVINRSLCYTPLKDTITKKKPINKDLIRIVEILNGRKYQTDPPIIQ